MFEREIEVLAPLAPSAPAGGHGFIHWPESVMGSRAGVRMGLRKNGLYHGKEEASGLRLRLEADFGG